MSGPLQVYLYIHDAILREVADLELVARELNGEDATEVTALADRMTWFHKMVKQHEHAEEEILFPAMNDRYRFVAETYKFDHDHFEDQVFDGIDAAFAGLARSNGNGERKDHLRLLHRQNIALNVHMKLHISKENELLIPKLEKEFDIEEQIAIAGGMAGMFDPQLMGETVGFMYRGQSVQDREGMIRFLMNVLPEEAFGGLSGMLEGMGADDWAEMQRRIPELSA